MAGVYTVAQVTSYISRMFEEDFALNRLSVKGEVSNCRYHTSGHIYFTLKDEKSTLSCIMFAAYARELSFRLKEGMLITVKGSIRVYERDGKYQMYAVSAETEGTGQWYRIFEERKQKLAEMGMFAVEYKKPIPKFCTRIGVVTARTGAVIQDIINIATRRNPYVSITLFPVLVQGEQAAADIVRGIEYLDTLNLDCIIVGRGGGSIEDLWAFNEEEVAMAVFQCDTPVISAVGHETDFTIADFVADCRAATPSEAAELAVFEYDAFIQELEAYAEDMKLSLRLSIEASRKKLENAGLRLQLSHPKMKLKDKRELLNHEKDMMGMYIRKKLEAERNRLALAAGRIEGASPLARLKGGYGFITDKNNTAVQSVSQLSKDECINIYMKDGTIKASVQEVREVTKNDH